MSKQQNRAHSGARRRSRRRRSRRNKVILLCIIAAVLVAAACFLIGKLLFRPDYSQAAAYEKTHYAESVYRGSLFAADLCVTDKDQALNGFTEDTSLHAAGLFDLDKKEVLYAYHLHDRLFPASTTKIMTAYLTLKYGNLDDVVTVSSTATDFEWDEQVCNLETGDQVTLYDLLCGLVLHSGNDCAVAIAEHISGSVEEFAKLMNQEAKALGATNTHFVNPHGLHDEDHYTTAYDLYLMFNACAKDQRFLDIISMSSYTGTLTGTDGTVRKEQWLPSNYYSLGEATGPAGVNIFGGKTGTTDEAGSCVVLYSTDMENRPYISIVMGADDKTILYDDMTNLLAAGIAGQQ